jgi:hypothetical protein
LQDLDAADFAFDPVRVGLGGRDSQECLSDRGLKCFRGSHNSNSIIGVG